MGMYEETRMRKGHREHRGVKEERYKRRQKNKLNRET